MAALVSTGAQAKDFWFFETGQVRPLALSPDGDRLFALNTPDNRLEIFSIGPGGLSFEYSVPVGLEPISVAARSNAEVWVVNHLSDSISIVDVSSDPPSVTRTLLVGDEPRDIVFAGTPPDPNQPFPRAFISAAHRGQVHPADPNGEKYGDFFTPSVGRADLWIFDANSLGSALGGTPETILTLFGDTPRALAATPSGDKVYLSVFHSGNRTTAIPNRILPIEPGSIDIGAIAAFNGSTWTARGGIDVSSYIKLELPDYDVFSIDADAVTPVELDRFSGVGTILFDMLVDPNTGVLYVSNTEANNAQRFESEVKSKIHQARITLIDDPNVETRHLNTHIDYEVVPSPAGIAEKSLATPMGMAISGDTLYVAAFGSSKVGVFSTSELIADGFTPDPNNQISVSGGGPTSVVVDEINDRLYVLTRFDNSISVIDKSAESEIDHIALHNPEPADVLAGRPFLYDAIATSSNGEASCSACHVFGDLDSLSWDLGDPNGSIIPQNNLFELGFGTSVHPQKGPMTTQTFRGMANHGPMHWRGDKTGADDPNVGTQFDEEAAFKAFNPAFVGLLGRSSQLNAIEIQAFADYALQIVSPPNPIANLDNSLSAAEAHGLVVFNTPFTDQASKSCIQCHGLDSSQGFFGTKGFLSILPGAEPQDFKIPQLRNLYSKVGMFGGVSNSLFPRLGDPNQPQIRGFGYSHDGSIDSVLSFVNTFIFQLPIDPNDPNGMPGEVSRQDTARLLMAFPSELAPIVGQQITLTAANQVAAGARIDLMIARALVSYPSPEDPNQVECDIVVKGSVAGEDRGWTMNAAQLFVPDRASESVLNDASLRAVATGGGDPLTYTCVPPGSGVRIGIDRDRDLLLDADEKYFWYSDPGDPDSDDDTLLDSADNCPKFANLGQADTGGVASLADPNGALPDGFGDACQCGDTSDNGRVTDLDVTELRDHLAWIGPALSSGGLGKCDTLAPAGSCDVGDWVVLARELAQLGPGIEHVCAPVVP